MAKRDTNKPLIAICVETGCIYLGVHKVITAFRRIERQRREDNINVREAGCLTYKLK
ncbi:MAG: hypothetical protein JW878_00435 [Methanomicrobia archaeon]|nr:hypothetical protein [Methanomicrobia archaeon]